MTTKLDRVAANLKAAIDEVTKQRDKRDKAIEVLIRTEARYREAVKVVGRKQRLLDKARDEEREAKAARKQAKAESKRELPDIATAINGG